MPCRVSISEAHCTKSIPMRRNAFQLLRPTRAGDPGINPPYKSARSLEDIVNLFLIYASKLLMLSMLFPRTF